MPGALSRLPLIYTTLPRPMEWESLPQRGPAQVFLNSKAHILSSTACFPKRVPWDVHCCLGKGGDGQLLVDKRFGKHWVRQPSLH